MVIAVLVLPATVPATLPATVLATAAVTAGGATVARMVVLGPLVVLDMAISPGWCDGYQRNDIITTIDTVRLSQRDKYESSREYEQ
jgi:hypothetical protein